MNISNPANTAILQTEHAAIAATLAGTALVIPVVASNDILIEENTELQNAAAFFIIEKVFTSHLLAGVCRIRLELKNPTAGKFCVVRLYNEAGAMLWTDTTVGIGYEWVTHDFDVLPKRTFLVEIKNTAASTGYIRGTQICGVASAAGGTICIPILV